MKKLWKRERKFRKEWTLNQQQKGEIYILLAVLIIIFIWTQFP